MLYVKHVSEVSELIPTRQSLLSRLRDWNDHDSWKQFFDTYWRLIYLAARKSGLSDAEAQDIVQETVIQVMKKMPEFKYDSTKGSFKGWLLQITKWRVMDHLRDRAVRMERNSKMVSLSPADSAMTADGTNHYLESVWEAEWEQNLLEAALDRVKRKVDSKHFQVFDSVVRKEWPISKVTEMFGMSRGRVYLIKHRIGTMVKKELANLRAKPI